MFKRNIQPYPGLRPFTEDEAIFFKGRDKQIKEIIKQLEAKKFVMVTGASGDGKSSIVYAGIIPNIRAGFFKADYNNWCFAELKPEKTPMANLASALSKSLNIDIEIVLEKLKFGFSAIVDLYKSSEFFLDKKSKEWKEGSIEEKKKLKKKAANLFILFDQFEEFFTNTENYNNGKPSNESNLSKSLCIRKLKSSYFLFTDTISVTPFISFLLSHFHIFHTYQFFIFLPQFGQNLCPSLISWQPQCRHLYQVA